MRLKRAVLDDCQALFDMPIGGEVVRFDRPEEIFTKDGIAFQKTESWIFRVITNPQGELGSYRNDPYEVSSGTLLVQIEDDYIEI